MPNVWLGTPRCFRCSVFQEVPQIFILFCKGNTVSPWCFAWTLVSILLSKSRGARNPRRDRVHADSGAWGSFCARQHNDPRRRGERSAVIPPAIPTSNAPSLPFSTPHPVPLLPGGVSFHIVKMGNKVLPTPFPSCTRVVGTPRRGYSQSTHRKNTGTFAAD